MKYVDLFEKSKQIAKDNSLTQLEVYQRFMFERILERISVSKYRDNFILKGGLLLLKKKALYNLFQCVILMKN